MNLPPHQAFGNMCFCPPPSHGVYTGHSSLCRRVAGNRCGSCPVASHSLCEGRTSPNTIPQPLSSPGPPPPPAPLAPRPPPPSPEKGPHVPAHPLAPDALLPTGTPSVPSFSSSTTSTSTFSPTHTTPTATGTPTGMSSVCRRGSCVFGCVAARRLGVHWHWECHRLCMRQRLSG